MWERRQHGRNGLGVAKACQGAEYGRDGWCITLQQTDERWHGAAIAQRRKCIHRALLDPPVSIIQGPDQGAERLRVPRRIENFHGAAADHGIRILEQWDDCLYDLRPPDVPQGVSSTDAYPPVLVPKHP